MPVYLNPPASAEARRRTLTSAAQRRTLRSGRDSLCAPLHPPLHFRGTPTADRSRVSVIFAF